MTATKCRPILYSGPMVRALLSGIKTQTRRVMRPQPQESFSADYGPDGGTIARRSYGWWWRARPDDQGISALDPEIAGLCPYGVPGDRLWVRETWQHLDSCSGEQTVYRATDAGPGGESAAGLGWRPSIFMPRSACRIILEITEVRVQRIQEISHADILAEGISAEMARDAVADPRTGRMKSTIGAAYRAGWVHLWDTINAGRGFPWASNPWTWAITFRPAEGGDPWSTAP